jgi:DNA-binding response OmpR family regulator
VNGAARRPRILVADSDREIVDIVATFLQDDGYSVVRAYDGDAVLALHDETKPDLVMFELMIPKRSGLDLLRDLRRVSDVPIIVCTARASEADRIVGLELGADDYVTKPFSPRELVARMGAVLRRATCSCGAFRSARVAQTPEIEVDREAHEARRNGRLLPLTPTEYRILEALSRNPGQILTRAQLLDAIATDGEVYDRTLDKHIANLRKKIERDSAHPRLVLTVFGIGYKFARL